MVKQVATHIALHESVHGTDLTIRNVRYCAASRGKADLSRTVPKRRCWP